MILMRLKYEHLLALCIFCGLAELNNHNTIGLKFNVQGKMKLDLGEQQFGIGESKGIATLTPSGVRRIFQLGGFQK